MKEIGIRQATKDETIPCRVGGVADFSYPTSKFRRGRVQSNGDVSPTITTSCGVGKVMNKDQIEENFISDDIQPLCEIYADDEKPKDANGKTLEDYLYTANDGEQYGIFKLTPRECGRLMDVRDEDIDKMFAVNSNSQCYRQFGNSIVCVVLAAIFSQLNIQGIKPWNERTLEEKEQLLGWKRDTTKQ